MKTKFRFLKKSLIGGKIYWMSFNHEQSLYPNMMVGTIKYIINNSYEFGDYSSDLARSSFTDFYNFYVSFHDNNIHSDNFPVLFEIHCKNNKIDLKGE